MLPCFQDNAISNAKVAIGILFFFGFMLVASLGYAKDFYVDALDGRDSNSGSSPGQAWTTISRVNTESFGPGDNVYFRRGQTWEEQLIVPSSGSAGKFITFGAYGEGNNPKIKCSSLFSEWVLVVDQPRLKIWKGSMRGIKNSFGAMKDGVRTPKYFEYKEPGNIWSAPKDILTMENGFFFSPLNGSEFYFRNDGGNPGAMEIGARKHGIYIKAQKYIRVENIDVYGPGGRDDNGTATGSAQIIVDSSNNVVINNCTISYHNGIGATICNKSSNCSYEYVKSYGHQGTGLYFEVAGPGNKAIGCEIYRCGSLQTDHGDMGGIGIWKTPNVIIESCALRDNGHRGASNFDAAISFVQSSRGKVNRTWLKNSGGTGIQFAENSDHCIASYNIIDRWGVYNNKGHNDGIRIGGGYKNSTAKWCKIYNNLIMNGEMVAGEWGALRVHFHDNEGLEVKNNIFMDNGKAFDIKAESRDGFKNWVFSNNLFYRTGGKAINWAGKIYEAKSIIGNQPGYYSYDQKQENGSKFANPKLTSSRNALQPDSPCIDAGTSVGLSGDFYGIPVPQGPRVDIGPFEFTKVSGPKK